MLAAAASGTVRVLLVEDAESDALLIVRHLERHGFDIAVSRVDSREAVEAHLASGGWDVVICDYSLPRLTALDVLAMVRDTDSDLPFLIVSGSIGEETAVDAMRRGAHDYIMKDRMARLAPAVERELREAAIRRERRRAQDRIRAYAYVDTLTGLPNLVRLQEHLEYAAGQVTGADPGFALLALTLSRFREVNESLGYANGDELLRGVGARLCAVAGGDDVVVARIGGDEFAVLVRGCDMERARGRGEAILRRMEAPFQVGGFPIEVTTNIGLAHYPSHAASARELLQKADVALSLARSMGAGFAVYDAARDPSHPGRLLLLGELRGAVAKRRIVPYLQPKVRLVDGTVSGAEALARWRTADRGDVGPDRFIPLAERSGLIGALTRSILETSVAEARRWRGQGAPIPVAVNISPKGLAGQELTRAVEAMLETGLLAPGMLELEITESALMVDPLHTLSVLRELNALGIALYIDDFGTGYSSLAYLHRLPATAIKIDRSFIAAMGNDADADKIVRSTIDLAHGLGLKVVAEGVEDQATLERLRECGCDQAQGYLIARPMPPAQFDRWLAERRP